ISTSELPKPRTSTVMLLRPSKFRGRPPRISGGHGQSAAACPGAAANRPQNHATFAGPIPAGFRGSIRPMDAQLVDRIYESCFSPQVWPEVLDEMGRIAGAPGASLFVSKCDVLHWSRRP